MWKLIFIATIVFVRTTLCQVSVSRCNNRWANQVRCLREGASRQGRYDSSFPIPDPGSQNSIKRAVDNCFRQAGCQSSPAPTNQETNVRRDCFRIAKRELDQELNRCVDSGIRGWNPPDDYARIDLDEWAYAVNRVYDSLRNSRPYCNDNRRNQALEKCVDMKTAYNFDQRPSRNLPSYWCDEDARCWTETTTECQQQWDDVVQPKLCSCSRRLGPDHFTSQALNTYQQCVSRRIRDQLPNDDPGKQWLTDYVRDLCTNKNNNPCRRQRREFGR